MLSKCYAEIKGIKTILGLRAHLGSGPWSQLIKKAFTCQYSLHDVQVVITHM